MNEGLRIGKFWFAPELPKEILDCCKDILLDHEYMIPSWCETVTVGWNPVEDENSAAYIQITYEYRTAHITICPLFLNDDAPDRRIKLKHELSHIINAPLVNWFRSTIKTLTKDKEEMLQDLVLEGIREKFESVTEDIARMLTRMEQKYNISNE